MTRLDKDCRLLHPTIYSFLLSDCLLLGVAPSLSLPWFCVDSSMVMVYWSASRPTLSTDSSRCRTQRRDLWFSVSVDLIISRMHSSASIGCECLKGLFLRSRCRLFELAMATSRRTCGSSHRSPTSRLDKDCRLLHPTIYSFLLSDCLLLGVASSLSPALVYGMTYAKNCSLMQTLTRGTR